MHQEADFADYFWLRKGFHICDELSLRLYALHSVFCSCPGQVSCEVRCCIDSERTLRQSPVQGRRWPLQHRGSLGPVCQFPTRFRSELCFCHEAWHPSNICPAPDVSELGLHILGINGKKHPAPASSLGSVKVFDSTIAELSPRKALD